MTTGSDIQDRLSDFAVRVIELCEGLPGTFAGRHIGTQLLRAGATAAANYAEVRGAESRNDFIHKPRKELNEALVRLRLVERRAMVETRVIEPLSAECDELCRIIAASRKTAEENSRLGKKP